MHLKVSQKRFVFIAFVLFTLLHTVVMKIGCSLFRLSYTLSKIHHEILGGRGLRLHNILSFGMANCIQFRNYAKK